ncbi:MAG: hypothetical protein JF586_19615 [Burkholderiales bacterium]|nr:hypothetical protein [Burkholderiales bacterium]
MPDLPPAPSPLELPADAPPSSAPWVSTQTDMETAARPQRTRLFRVRMKTGHVRVAGVTYFQATQASATDSRVEHLYRVQLSWLAEFDPRDGKSQRFAERTSTGRATNALQFRVLEMSTDGRRVSAARLGPKGQILAEPAGMGIMSLLRALLVEWVAGLHPEATVLTGSLYQVDVPGDKEMELRDAFFARSGFTVRPTSGGGGSFFARSVRELKSTWNTDKAQELTAPLLAEAVSAQMETPLLRQQIAALQDQLGTAIKEKRATEVLSRIWLAITVLAVIFGLVFGIQPRLG